MEKHDLVEGRKCPHERLIHFVGPCGRRIVAEGCGEIQIAAFGVEPRCTEGLRIGICPLPVAHKQMMEPIRSDDEAYLPDARGTK